MPKTGVYSEVEDPYTVKPERYTLYLFLSLLIL